jgi:hypothetical protein
MHNNRKGSISSTKDQYINPKAGASVEQTNKQKIKVWLRQGSKVKTTKHTGNPSR